MQDKTQATLGKIVAWTLVSATLLVTPLWSLDPINPIKMAAICTFGFVGLGALLSDIKFYKFANIKTSLMLICSFVAWQFVVLLMSGGEKLQQLFGTNGRNTGLITYLAFSILFIISVVAASPSFLIRFFKTVLVVGTTSIGYGLIQSIGADPFNWANAYTAVFGFLGNPNFQSSLLGILGAIVFAQLLSGSVKIEIKAFFLVYILFTVYIIKETSSLQGYLVLLIGSAVSLGIFVNQKNHALGISYFGFSFVSFLGIIAGTLNKGPLASVLYQDSVTYRGDYWRAGWKMTLENPIFGVGMDSYGDWYRRSRTLEATLRRGPEVTSNAAHNVFLDISAYGGFPLVLIYIALMVLVIFSAVKVIKRSQGFNPGFVGMIAGWVAFQAQSIISINQIGLALWGWVLSGLIIGYEINTRGSDVEVEKKVGKKVTKPVQTSASTTLAMFAGLVVGVLVGMPPYVASAKYKGALESSNPTIIQQAAYIWPADPARMIQVSMTLNDNKFEDQGLAVALDGVKKFPDNYGVWAALSSMKRASVEQKAQALAQMKRLDPLNPNLK